MLPTLQRQHALLQTCADAFDFCNTQGHRQEVIGALAEVVRQMLLEFYHRNGGKKPEAIIYYRDGVADSQFPTVLEHEYKAFRHVGILAEGGSPSCSACGKLLSVRVCCLLLQTEAFLGSD